MLPLFNRMVVETSGSAQKVMLIRFDGMGLLSFRYKMEVVSIYILSRFDGHMKSIRYKLKSVR